MSIGHLKTYCYHDTLLPTRSQLLQQGQNYSNKATTPNRVTLFGGHFLSSHEKVYSGSQFMVTVNHVEGPGHVSSIVKKQRELYTWAVFTVYFFSTVNDPSLGNGAIYNR